MNKLAMLGEWAKTQLVDLNRGHIEMNAYTYSADREAINKAFGVPEASIPVHIELTFWHSDETAASFRQIKRAVGGALEAVGDNGSLLESQFVRLREDYVDPQSPSTFLRVRYQGAYECTTTKTIKCVPVAFPDNEDEGVEGEIFQSDQ
jgi:hypothetical protein